jgi:hypothetical protein
MYSMFLVIVIRKLLKNLAIFVGFFNFASLSSKVGTCYIECTSLASFSILVNVVFVLLLDFAVSLLKC